MKLHLKGLTLLALLCSTVTAQEFRATISGHILDSSGANVPSTKVQIVNVGTNETATATSDASGAYSIPFLRPGAYKLTVTATGFKQYLRNVTLEAAKTAGVDIILEVGQITEVIQVTGEAALLDTQSASRGGVVTNQMVAELPLNARNPFMLGAMMSGVTFNGAAIWQRPFDNGAIAQWSMNGSRDSSSAYMLDGASNEAGLKVEPVIVKAAATVHDGDFVPVPIPEGEYFGIVWRRGTVAASHRTVEQVAAQIRDTLWKQRTEAAEKKLIDELRAKNVKEVNEGLLGIVELRPFDAGVSLGARDQAWE